MMKFYNVIKKSNTCLEFLKEPLSVPELCEMQMKLACKSVTDWNLDHAFSSIKEKKWKILLYWTGFDNEGRTILT